MPGEASARIRRPGCAQAHVVAQGTTLSVTKPRPIPVPIQGVAVSYPRPATLAQPRGSLPAGRLLVTSLVHTPG
ncbi:MAG TPA: hypothetical protein VGS19_30825 [Streptosporangiaceae bacterium]|nr:hypothetical protein [Streptosporangiaceae bacterium]